MFQVYSTTKRHHTATNGLHPKQSLSVPILPLFHLQISPTFPSGHHHTVVSKASCFYYFVSIYEAQLLPSDRDNLLVHWMSPVAPPQVTWLDRECFRNSTWSWCWDSSLLGSQRSRTGFLGLHNANPTCEAQGLLTSFVFSQLL